MAINEDIALSFIKSEINQIAESSEKDSVDLENKAETNNSKLTPEIIDKAIKIAKKRNKLYFDDYFFFSKEVLTQTQTKISTQNEMLQIYSQLDFKASFIAFSLSTHMRTMVLDDINIFGYPKFECEHECGNCGRCDQELGECTPDYTIAKANPKLYEAEPILEDGKYLCKEKPQWRGKRIFTSSSKYSGDLISEAKKHAPNTYNWFLKQNNDIPNGIKAADALCSARAQAARLGGAWRAILSSSRYDAKDRLRANKRLYLVDRYTVATSKNLWDGAPNKFISKDEFGRKLKSGAEVWSGTDITGLRQSTLSLVFCEDWTSTTGTGRSGIAFSQVIKPYFNWISYGAGAQCAKPRSLYCFEV